MKYWILLLFFPLFLSAQEDRSIDSLKRITQSNVHDSVRIKAYFAWDDYIFTSDPRLDMQLNMKVISLCEKNLAKPSLNKKEILYYNKSLARALNNKGLVSLDKSKVMEALDAFTQSNQIAKKYNLKTLEAFTINNFGNVYRDLNEFEKALKYYRQSFEIFKDSMSFNNIGLCYSDLGDTANAMKYFRISLDFSRSSGNLLNEANTLSNMAEIYKGTGQYAKAMEYFVEAKKIYEEIEQKQGLAFILYNIGDLKREGKKYKEAISNCKASYDMAIQHELLMSKRGSCYCLYATYKESGQADSALTYLEKYNVFNKEHLDQVKNNQVIKKEFQIEFDARRQIEQTKHKKELEVSNEKQKRQRIISWFFGSGLFIIVIFAFVIFRSLNATRRQNKIIEEQKRLVEGKNREILDSISYAKRLQDAILPPLSIWKTYLPESFILYKPKDIVAGDFYWLEPIRLNTGNGNRIMIAAADCTGHGVPGAMVSVVCSNALNRAVKEFGISEPGEILDKVRELVIETFASYDMQIEEEMQVKDGMDISLCAIQTDSGHLETWSSQQGILQWAGANNPLWIVRKDEQNEYRLIEYKPDNQPIGKHYNARNFTTHTIEMQAEDTIYMFTDGFADQFGGERLPEGKLGGKKYKSRKMKDFILSIQQYSMDEQLHLIDREFQEWKQDLDQVDDICIVGFRL